MSNIIKKESGEITPAPAREYTFEAYYKFREVELDNGEFVPELISQWRSHPTLDRILSASDVKMEYIYPDVPYLYFLRLRSDEHDMELSFEFDDHFGTAYDTSDIINRPRMCYLMFCDEEYETYEILVLYDSFIRDYISGYKGSELLEEMEDLRGRDRKHQLAS